VNFDEVQRFEYHTQTRTFTIWFAEHVNFDARQVLNYAIEITGDTVMVVRIFKGDQFVLEVTTKEQNP
jgi:hypothetical protein